MWIRGKIFFNNEVIDGCVNFDRKIKEIRKDCKPDIDVPQGKIIFPGSIDMHVHVRGMNLSYKENVRTATSEAAYGGVTVIVDMPNTVPYINTAERVQERLREFANFSRTDYGIYSGVTSDERVDKLPIAGYKVFPEDLEKPELQFVLSSKKLKILHPELPLSIKQFRDLREMWQEIASLNLIYGRFHITHITNYETLIKAKELGFTTDFTPHHLLLDEIRGNCLTKVNPPIRDLTERRKLIKALFEADAVASDHAPHTLQEKMQPYELCPPGIAAVSFTTPFIYSLVKKGILSLTRAVDLVSRNPAKILGINAGEIKEGNVADFTVIDFDKDWRYHTQYSKVVETPFDGYSLDVSIYMTIIEGKVAYDGYEVYPIRGMNLFENSQP